MRTPPQIRMLPDGRRMHLQDGPIDLSSCEAFGAPEAIRRPTLRQPRVSAVFLTSCVTNSRSCACPLILTAAFCRVRLRGACMRRWRLSLPTVSSLRWLRWLALWRRKSSTP